MKYIFVVSETLYGNVDVKSKPVHFYVQRLSNFNLTDVTLPFEQEILNIGGAMNTASGVFTAPVDGIYRFEFSGMKWDTATYVFVSLQVNGVRVADTYATGLPNHLALSGINASLRLKTGDQVRLFKGPGILRDDSRFTQFTGWLVEEDLLL